MGIDTNSEISFASIVLIRMCVCTHSCFLEVVFLQTQVICAENTPPKKTSCRTQKRKRCVRKSAGLYRRVLHFLIREETGTDVTGSQTGCSDYNTMKMAGDVMDTQRPKSRVLACAIMCKTRVCVSVYWWEVTLECYQDRSGSRSRSGLYWVINYRDMSSNFPKRFSPSSCTHILYTPSPSWGCPGSSSWQDACEEEKITCRFSAECWLLLISGCWLLQDFCWLEAGDILIM